MKALHSDANPGRQRNAHALAQASWKLVRDIAYGIDTWSAVKHGADPSQRASARRGGSGATDPPAQRAA